MNSAAVCLVLSSVFAQSGVDASVRGRLWVEWQGQAYHHWAGEVRLSAGRVLRARCRKMVGKAGILKGHDEHSAAWQTHEGYDAGTCHSIVLDVAAPESTKVALRLPNGKLSAALLALRRDKREVFGDGSYLSLEFRVLFPRATVERLTRVKKLYRQTPLVSGGKALAAIVAAKLPLHQTQARRIQQAVRVRTGVELPLLDAAALADADYRLKTDSHKTHHLILLGDVNSNPVLVQLSAQGYAVVDAQFPGDGGFILRSICDPWGAGKSAILVGAGDEAGLKTAVDRLLARPELAQGTGDLVLPILATLVYGKRGSVLPASLVSSYYYPEYKVLERRGIRLQPGSPIEKNNLHNFLVPFGMLGATYGRTGDEAYPAHVKAKLDELGLVAFLRDRWDDFVAWRKANPDKFHLFFRGVAVGWDWLEESPAFTDEDRLAVTNVLWNIMNGMCTRRDKFWLKPGQTELQQGVLMFHSPNHETWSALALYQLGSYFRKYYPEREESDYWLELAHAEFAGHETTFEMIEDAKSFQARDTRSCMAYALSSGNMGYFRRGVAKAAADFECVVTDNLGHGSGYGDAGLTVSGVPSDIITRAEWFYRTGEHQWLAQNLLRSPTKVPLWACRSTPKRPDRFLGIHVVPAHRWGQTNNVHFRSDEWRDYAKEPRTGYNKISFREDFAPSAQYLLMDGRRKLAYHNQDDSNTIVRFTDNGRFWIVDDHPSLRGLKHQNAISYDRDGRGASLGADAVARVVADLGKLGFVRSEVPVFGSASWTRSVIWHKRDWFVVFDHLIAAKPGDYLVRCHWRFRGKPTYDASGVTLEQQGEKFRLCSAGSYALHHEDLDMADIWARDEANYGYKFAEPVCRILHEEQRRVLGKRGRVGFANLFYAFNDREPIRLRLAEVTDSLALLQGEVRSTSLEAIVGVDGADGATDLATDAALFYLSPDRWALARVSKLSIAGRPVLEASQPISFEFSFGDNTGQVHADTACQVRFHAGERFRVDGRKPDETGAVALAPGVFRIDGLPRHGAEVRRVLGKARQQSEQRKTAQQAQQAVPVLPAAVLWRRELSAEVTTCGAGDMDGDGEMDLLVGTATGNALAMRASNGEPLWRFQTKGPVRALVAADVDEDGATEAIVCANDAHCVDRSGKERWRFQTMAMRRGGEGRAFAAAAAKMKGIPGTSVLIGDARLNVLTPKGKLVWHQPPDGLPLPGKWMPHHYVAAADVDGDGFDEALGGVQMSYPFAYAMDGQRELVWHFPPKSPGDWRVGRRPVPGRVTLLRCADLDGDGRVETIFAGTSGGLRVCHRVDGRWHESTMPMVDEATAVAIRPASAGDPGLVLAADASYFLYLFRFTTVESERVQWRRRLGQALSAVAFCDLGKAQLFLAGTRSGQVLLLDARGRVRGQVGTSLGEQIVRLQAIPARRSVICVGKNGLVEARQLGPPEALKP